ncbi:UNVERIFIED_CONTAM: hypothetical protein PYX00_004009 [Menopon gallinae]|uniref:Guanine nucleotide-binding protein subunit beta-like protein 1 n=1 Tax=Menopon gallinae TaxID=328185 RepID=A0AAW2I3P0_9NEOP
MPMLPPDPVYIFKGDMESVFCVMFKELNEKSVLYAGTQSGLVHVWDLKINRQIASFESSKESCLSIHSNEVATDITQDKMGVIRIWMQEDMKWTLLKSIETDYYGFCKCVLYDNVLYTALQKGRVKSICLKSTEDTSTYNFIEDGKANEIMCFKLFSMNNETFILVAFETCDVSLFSLREQKLLGSLKVDECPMALDFDAVAMKGVCGCPTEKLLVFTLNKNFEMNVKQSIILKNPGVASVAIRPDSKLMAVGCWDGKLRLYSMKSLSILAVLDIHSSTVQDVVFTSTQSENGKIKFYLAAGSKDRKISLWDLYN